MPDFLDKKSSIEFEFLDAKECLNILRDEEKKELVDNKTDLVFEAGEVIIKRGILASNILYLNKGLVKLEVVNDNKLSTIGLIQSHSFIGIICCFAFKKYDFTVTAIERTEVSFIDITIFERFIINNGEFALNLIRHMSGITNKLFHRITALSQKNIEGALSMLLLDFCDIYRSENFILPVTRQELAHLLGYSKESVINTLSKFNKEGIIKVSDRKIELINSEKLIQISKLG